jgi:hypothetical protein
MKRFTHLLTVTGVMLVSVAGVASCGGSDPSGSVVAHVGSTPISRAMLNEWMGAVVGGDYYEHLSTPAPVGLVSDPADYPKCISAAETIVPKSSTGQLALTRSQISGKCRLLQQALKEQALELLISIESRIGEGGELGIPPTTAEVNHLFSMIKAREFPKPGEYQTFLAERHWNNSVEVLQIKRNIVVSKIQAKFQAKGQGFTRAYISYVEQSAKKWTAKTTCSQGYIVAGCKEYKASPQQESSKPAPALLLEELAGRTS